MNRKINLIELWKKKGKIFEGITHSIFRREDVEAIAEQRLAICRENTCGFHDPEGKSPNAVLKGAESCASCGCKLAWKTRALSDECPVALWRAVLTDVEEAVLKEKLGMGEDEG
jgi:hypothetical protein